jgi:hypothetical protein
MELIRVDEERAAVFDAEGIFVFEHPRQVARKIPVSSIVSGPLRRESLTSEQEQQARTVAGR